MLQPRPNRHRTAPIGVVSRLLLIGAAACLLTMPSIYDGGAEFPHPHALFQFWCAADGDAFDHHGAHDDTAFASEDVSADRYDRPDRPTIQQSSTPFEFGSALALVSRTPANPPAEQERSGAIPTRASCSSEHLVTPDPPPPRSAIA